MLLLIMIVTIILSILLILICGIRVIDAIDSKRDKPLDFVCIVGIILFSILSGVLVTIHVGNNLSELKEEVEKTKPTAIDVYKGKTSLSVVYEDSVAVDSTVIFKD